MASLELFRFFHTADLHWSAKHLQECQKSHRFLGEKIDELKPNVLVIAGDWWNSPQELTDDSAANPSLHAFQELADKVPIVMIKGNRAHDDNGSLEVFKNMRTECDKFITESIATTFLTNDPYPCFSDKRPFGAKILAIFHCFSYPEKGYFLKGKEGMSIDEANAAIIDEISKIMLGFAAINAEYPYIPSILVFHGNVKGCKISNGQTLISQDILIPTDVLELANCNYYAGGHIHKGQVLDKEGRMWYSGSTHHVTYGETEKKFFNSVMMDNGAGGMWPKVTTIVFPSTPLAFHECRYDPENNELIDLLIDKGQPVERDWEGADLRVQLHITENESILVTDDIVREFYPGAHEYKIERTKTANTRVRSQEIAGVKRLKDKFGIWMKDKGKEATPEMLELCDETEERS
jgi:DNA repair exonuclease SbcCD nuclease subunit